MKISRGEKQFEPIQLTIETLDELKWIVALANTSEQTVREVGRDMGIELPKTDAAQMALWNALSPVRRETGYGG